VVHVTERVESIVANVVGKVVRRVGPDHPITVEPAAEHVVVKLGDCVVADTAAALVLREASYPPVYYVPRDDIDAAVLRPSGTSSYCPYKGTAGYVSLDTGDERVIDAGWCYERPYDDVAAIAGRIAFYPDRVSVEAG
jgi:uncharacterized protein (DUF427 family)